MLNSATAREDELERPLSLTRTLFNYGVTAIAFSLTGLALLPLFAILVKIIWAGAPNLRWESLTALPAAVGVPGPDGFANAILGTFLMVGIGALLSIPISIATAIYLCEFGRNNALSKVIRFVISILSGIPSVVVGVFAYGVIVLSTKTPSALAGGFALAVIMLPIVVLATEEALKLVPMAQRSASSALGANAMQTTCKIVITAALPGITTGILLAIARAAGETAPLLFTASFSQYWLEGLQSPTPSLSVLIYNYAISPSAAQNQMAWTASLVLVSLVVVVNLLSRIVTRNRLTR
jgi:phosphate transport system permease protein